MAALKNRTGQRFGRLMVIGRAPNQPGVSNAIWECQCDCGRITTVNSSNLSGHKVQSCGCLRREHAGNKVHGQAGDNPSQEYTAWTGMINRCYCPTSSSFERYGARGIQVCDRWRSGSGSKSGFECFFSDIGSKPSPDHQIDRIENDDHYHPGNCKWSTRKEQCSNRRDNVWVTWHGDRMLIDHARRASGVGRGTYYRRLAWGLTPQQAFDAALAVVAPR